MRSVVDEGDLTARAAIRNAGLRLFAERGHDAVTIRELAEDAGVSPALIVHHYGSKDGLRAAVDDFAAQAFDSIFDDLQAQDIATMLTGADAAGSMAEAFARSFPVGSPLPAYLRRLFLTDDAVGAELFGRWFDASHRLLGEMVSLGVATPSEDLAVRAAFLLINDLALILLRRPIAAAIGADPLTPDGIDRWAREATTVYSEGLFAVPSHSPKEQG